MLELIYWGAQLARFLRFSSLIVVLAVFLSWYPSTTIEASPRTDASRLTEDLQQRQPLNAFVLYHRHPLVIGDPELLGLTDIPYDEALIQHFVEAGVVCETEVGQYVHFSRGDEIPGYGRVQVLAGICEGFNGFTSLEIMYSAKDDGNYMNAAFMGGDIKVTELSPSLGVTLSTRTTMAIASQAYGTGLPAGWQLGYFLNGNYELQDGKLCRDCYIAQGIWQPRFAWNWGVTIKYISMTMCLTAINPITRETRLSAVCVPV